MSTAFGRQRDYRRSPDNLSRPELVGIHEGSCDDFLRRHELAAAEAVKQGPKGIEKIAPHLFERVADTRNLYMAWEHVAQNGGTAPGPNGHRCSDYEPHEVWEAVRAISNAIQNGTYRPGPVRKVRISKGPGRGYRTLSLMNVEDRVVQRAVLQIIQPLLDPVFEDFSYGFRPGRDRQHALANAEMLTIQEERTKWIVQDLKNAFDCVPRKRLLDVLRRRIPNDRLTQLIDVVTSNGTKRGLPQGAPLSPLLLNLFLDHFLDKVWKKPHPDLPLLRTADDLLIPCRTQEEAQKAHVELQRILMPTGMLLKHTPEKAIRDLAAGGTVTDNTAQWLGFNIRLGKHELEVRIAEHWQTQVRERFVLAHTKPGSPLLAICIVWGLVDQLGPCYPSEDGAQLYTQIVEVASELAFDEVPEYCLLMERWQRAYVRWCHLRREVSRTGCSSTTATTAATTECGGSARHVRFSVPWRRSDGVLHCSAPSLSFTFSSDEPSTLATDGCCLRATSVGGWAYILDAPSLIRPVVRHGGFKRTTNNRAELLAVIKGLESLSQPTAVQVLTDSEYVALGITKRLARWKLQGWRAGSGRHRRPLKNADLWQRLDAILASHRVTCQWVRGHTGHPLNEECDRLARAAAERLQRKQQEEAMS